MSDFSHFFDALQQSLAEDEFVKLTVSKPIRKSEGLLNVYMRLFVIDGKETFELKYRFVTENNYQQFSLNQVKTELESLLLKKFRTATLFTLSEDIILMVSKKKVVSYRDNAPSFGNKLPDILPQGL